MENLNRPELMDKKETHIGVKPKKEVEKGKKIQNVIPKEIMNKLSPEERDTLFRMITFKSNEGKNFELDLIKHHQSMHHELKDLNNMQEIELMIQLCCDKNELIKLLSDINIILLENSQKQYYVKVKKMGKRDHNEGRIKWKQRN